MGAYIHAPPGACVPIGSMPSSGKLSVTYCRPGNDPRLHQTWAQAEQQHCSALAAQRTHLLRRQQRLERQSQRLLDAYQTEAISLSE
jgi:hypothetical protein